MRITLTVEEGPHQGQAFAFEGHDLFLVGRSRKVHFRLRDKDKYFSRVHFMIEINPPLCRIMDMGSRNGTFVNGDRVQTALVKDGDRVKAGHTILRVGVAADPEDEVPPTPLPEPPTVTAAATSPDGDGTQPLAPPPSSDATVSAVSFQLPGYLLDRELGRGGMGVVYLAQRESDGVQVAVKTVVPGAVAGSREVRRFLREVEILRQLDHPGIVRYYDSGECAGVLFFVMEFVPGTDLQRVMRRQKKLKATTAVRVVCQVLEALAHAHAKGFVHRDVKPANVLLREPEADGKRRAKLADFGLGRIYKASRISGLTLQGDLGGTPHFMAPEQVTSYRDVSPAADQYSTAATLYYLLTGKFPLELPPMPQALLAIMEGVAVPLRERNPELPGGLAEAIHKALAKDPAGRFADANAFRLALLPFG